MSFKPSRAAALPRSFDRLPRQLAAVACFALLALTTRAEIVSFEFTGTANSVGSSLSPYFQVGDPYTLTLSYDTTTPNASSVPTTGTYKLISASMVVEASGGTWSADLNGGDGGQLQIENQGSYDRFEVLHTGFSNPNVAGQTASTWTLTMYTETTDTFTSTALPSSLDLGNWSTNPSSTRFHIYFEGLGSSFDVRFGVAKISTPSSTPGSSIAQHNVVSGSAEVVGADILHPNGQYFDQVLLTGLTTTLQADPGQVLRCSFLDENGDIVQCEFSGPGEVTITLDPETFVAAAPAPKYNQPDVLYVTGKPTITVTGNTADSHISIFSVGRGNAVNQALFPEGETYDAVADVALLQINGAAMGGVRAGNTRFSSDDGMTGIFAPNTNVAYRAILHDIKASANAIPVLQFGNDSALSLDSGSVLLAGGDLIQPNGASIDVTAGSGDTLLSIVTVANVRSDGSNITRVTISDSVTFVSGGTGTLLIDGTAVFDHSTGETSGTFAANFSDLLEGDDNPFDFGDGGIGLEWFFSGGNTGTWWVRSTTLTQGFSAISTLSGTYSYEISGNATSFTFTMNYNEVSSKVGDLPAMTLPINASSNPAMPKSIAMTVNRTGPSTGTYQYALTMTDGAVTEMSGNYSDDAPLAVPSGQ